MPKPMNQYTIERKSPLTGKVNTMVITMNPSDYCAWARGEMIQNALPYLTTDEREFIKTGLIGDEWDAMTSSGPWSELTKPMVLHIGEANDYNAEFGEHAIGQTTRVTSIEEAEDYNASHWSARKGDIAESE